MEIKADVKYWSEVQHNKLVIKNRIVKFENVIGETKKWIKIE